MIESWLEPVEVWLGVPVGVLVAVRLEIVLRQVGIVQRRRDRQQGSWLAEPLQRVVQQRVAGFWSEEEGQQQHLDAVGNPDLCSGMGYPAEREIHLPVWPCYELSVVGLAQIVRR